MELKKKAYNQLSLTQFIFLIYKTQIGVTVLTLPGKIAAKSDTDGLIAIFIGYLFSLFMGYIIIRFMEKHPGKTLFDILTDYFGQWMGKFLSFVWLTLTLFISYVIFSMSLFIIQVWMLPNTSMLLMNSLLLIPIYQITRQGVQILGRIAEFVFLCTLWMPFILFFTLKEVEWYNILPIIKHDWPTIFNACPVAFSCFIGFELILLFYPFLYDKKQAVKGMVISNSLTLFIQLVATVLCFVKFSQEELKVAFWPTLNLLKLIQFPFLERWEIIFLSFYLYVLLMTVIPYLYSSVYCMARISGKQDHRPYLITILIIWLFIPFFHDFTHGELTWAVGMLETVYMYFTVVFPLFLGLYSWVYRKWKRGPRGIGV